MGSAVQRPRGRAALLEIADCRSHRQGQSGSVRPRRVLLVLPAQSPSAKMRPLLWDVLKFTLMATGREGWDTLGKP